jgi:hypothetical protein
MVPPSSALCIHLPHSLSSHSLARSGRPTDSPLLSHDRAGRVKQAVPYAAVDTASGGGNGDRQHVSLSRVFPLPPLHPAPPELVDPSARPIRPPRASKPPDPTRQGAVGSPSIFDDSTGAMEGAVRSWTAGLSVLMSNSISLTRCASRRALRDALSR